MNEQTNQQTDFANQWITKQAAIDALGEKPLVWDDLSDFDLGKAAQWSDDVDAIKAQPSAQSEKTQLSGESTTKDSTFDCISRQAAIDALHMHLMYRMGTDSNKKRLDEWINNLPSAHLEQEDYTEMKREFLRMASYIDSLLVCPDEQKETLMNFISRIAEDMPWTQEDQNERFDFQTGGD